MRTRSPLASWQRLSRPVDGRLLGGVCMAIAERLSLHVWLVRLAFVVLGLANGLGVLVYLLAWILLPNEGERLNTPSLRSAARSRLSGLTGELSGLAESVRVAWYRGDRSPWPRPLSRRWIGLVLVAAGVVVLLASFDAFAWVTPVRALGMAMAAIGAGVLMSLYRE